MFRAGCRAALLAALAGLLPLRAGAATDPYPTAAAAYLVVADDHVLWSHNASTPRPPASLAKLLAVLVLLRAPWNEQALVTMSGKAAAIEGTRLGLKAGEQLHAGDALTAMLLRSANDVCLAMAEQAAGSSTAFVARMNALARELDLSQSDFRTPCGLDAPGQHSTASDLFKLARVAMERPEVATRVARTDASVTTAGGRRIHFSNNNALIGRLRGTIGVKSGFTSAAGKCVIALAERDGHRVWLVMLDAPNRWWIADGMIEAAFAKLASDGH